MARITYKWVKVDNPDYPTFHAVMPLCTLSISEYPHGWCWGAFDRQNGDRLVPQDLCEGDKKQAMGAAAAWYVKYIAVKDGR